MKAPRRHTGHSLAGTMVFLVLAMLLWMGVCRQLASHLRVETARQKHQDRSTGCQRAMAWALSLLETGKPPWDGVNTDTYRMILDGEIYVAIFNKRKGGKCRVTVRPAMYPDDELWPLAPESF